MSWQCQGSHEDVHCLDFSWAFMAIAMTFHGTSMGCVLWSSSMGTVGALLCARMAIPGKCHMALCLDNAMGAHDFSWTFVYFHQLP